MKLCELIAAMEKIAPTANAESWDNVGLLAGDPQQTVSKVLLTIDYTAEVADEGRRAGCDAVIAYHPPIFQALKRVVAGNPVFDAIHRGVAIYSPHTALDVADGGTNDVLCDLLELEQRSPLKLMETKASQYKLVTFVPQEQVEQVSDALFGAGAGRIANYTSCSFRSPGIGTFFGQEGTNPAVGQAGKLERAQEVRLETVVPLARVAQIVAALRQSHPYEEPAFDLQQLAAPPTGIGIGRIGSFASPVDRDVVIQSLKRDLGIDHLLVAGPTQGEAQRAAVCAGACGDLLNDALAQKADIYVTGEMRHHDALRAASAGMTVICTLHSNSERITLGRLKERLQKELSGLEYVLSQADRDPFSIR
jgi:dinuclear metal center YbgI/SA1388 family protein